MSDRVTRAIGLAAVALAAAFMLLPALLTALLSFSGDSFFRFPPESWGLRQYDTLLTSDTWGSALGLSFKIAVPVAVVSALIVVPTAFAVHRSRLPGRHALQVGGLAGVIIPIAAFAVAMYGVFVELGLLGTYVGLVISHTVLAVPIMLVVVAAAMSRIPAELELAAMVAGASRARAYLGITGRLLVPAILGGGVLAFVTSFDEAVFINFLGGAGQVTLPRAILNSARLGVDPVITAIATLLMVATSVLMFIAVRLSGRGT